MSTQLSTVWPKAHRVDGDRGETRYEVTGLWAGSLPSFVDGCVDEGAAYVEHRDGRTFVVVE